MTETTTIRWEQDDTGVVTLVLDDPGQSANTMNQAFRRVPRRGHRPAGGREGLDPRRHRHLRQEDLLRRRRPARPDPRHPGDRPGPLRRRPRHQARTCAASRPSACPSSPPSTARPSAAASRSPSPATTAIALDAPGSKIGCPEVTLGLLPGGGGVARTVRLLGITDALLKVLLQGTQYNPRRALENGLVARGRRRRREEHARQGPRLHRRQPRVRSSPGTSPATASPAAPRPTRSSPPTCPPSRPTCASRPPAPPTRRRATSSPPPSRAPRSTSRPRRSSRPATSWSWPPGRPRRT